MTDRIMTFTALATLLVVAGCGGGNDTASTGSQSDSATATKQTVSSTIEGTVIETMDAANYTYVHVEADGEKVWAAGPLCEMEVGNEVTIDTRMPMPNFHSETLDRTFDVLYFVGGFSADATARQSGGMSGMGSMSGMASSHTNPEPAADVDLSGIERAEGGHTVAEMFIDPTALDGNTVILRGKVVKYLPGIMGRNWLHLRDGTGDDGTNDLTVTTQSFAKVGDLVVIEGKVAADKDFGAGYFYNVIVENATVTKE